MSDSKGRIVQVPDASGPALRDDAAGPIEVLFDLPSGPARAVAIVAHPQPLLGGNAMHKMPHVLARVRFAPA